MERNGGGRGRKVAAALVWVGAVGLMVAVWQSGPKHRPDLSTYGAFAIAAAGLALTLAGWVRRGGAGRGGAAGAGGVLLLADRLAVAVREQWSRAAGERGLVEPVAVGWARPLTPMAGPAGAAAGSAWFAPLPGVAAVGRRELIAGWVDDLHGVYGGLGSGRLVIAGPPGSGKSGAAVLLILAALRHRDGLPAAERARVPVPVMFTLAGWDPRAQPVLDWLTARLRQTYPLFAASRGGKAVAELAAAGLLAVILDGLDEVAPALRPVALRVLSEQAGFRLVLLSRSAEMAGAAARAHLVSAVAVELQEVTPAAAADYLSRVQLDPPPQGWAELISRLRQAPDSPVARALRSPLALSLVRDTYSSDDDVRELLDACDAPGCEPGVITGYLLDRVLPAAYTPRPGRPPPRYSQTAAENALGRIAARMNRNQTRDLPWWRIHTLAPARPRAIAAGVAAAVVTGPVYGLIIGHLGRPADGLAAGFIGGLVSGITGGSVAWPAWPSRKSGDRGPHVARTHPAGTTATVRAGLGIGLGLALGVLAMIFYRKAGPAADLVIGLVIGLSVGIATGIAQVVLPLPEEGNVSASALGPLASWRSERRYAFAISLATGLILALGTALSAALSVGLELGIAGWLATYLAFWLIVTLAAGLLTWPITTQTSTASITFAQLALRWHTPLRLMRFLEDARDRNILRTVGPVYQFRHARLQDRLAEQAQARDRR